MNEVTLEEAYRAWADELVRYATVLVPRSDAADLVADTFADLLSSPDGPWSGARVPRGFLYGAVANRARMHHRSTRRRRERENRPVMVGGSVSGDSEAESAADTEIIGALDTLSVQQRAVTYLAYWDDQSVVQIAATLQTSEGTVRRQLARSRSKLRKALS